jgi:hypothetical protein
MIILGLILLIVGFVVGIHILWIVGGLLLLVGLVFLLLGRGGHPVAGRQYWW